MAEKYQLHRMVYELIKGSDEPGLKMTAKYLGGVLRAADEGKPIVYHGFTSFIDIMVAMDLQTICLEGWDLIGVRADPDHAIKSIDAAHEAGIPRELCSFDKAIIGSILRGVIPPPSMIVPSLFPCQNAVIGYQAIGHLTGAPLYTPHTPYYMDEEGAMDHWVRQYQGVIAFLEEHSGKKMDYDRLKEVVEESNRCVEYWLEAVELQKLKPAPHTGTISIGTQAGILAFGTPEGTAAVKAVLDDIKGRVARGETAVRDEKVRVIWFQLPVFWDTTLMTWMATELGAVTPFVLYDDYRVEPVDTSTPETMIRGMAKRALETPMGRQSRSDFDLVIEDVLYAVDEFSGDCVIFASHTCKWMSNSFNMLNDALRKRGIPALIYDVDLLDRRVTSAEESRTKIEQFLNTIIDRK